MRITLFILSFLISTAIAAQPLTIDEGATQVALITDVDGNILYEHDANRQVTPASLTKLFTTAAALETLGANAKIDTRVYLANNNIYIEGHADPTYNSEFYKWHNIDGLAENIVAELKSRNIRRINSLVLNDGYIQGSPYISKHIWEDMGNYYGAVPHAFNIYDNTQTIELSSPQEIGAPCKIKSVYPSVGQMPECFVKTYSKQSDSVYVYGTDETRYLSGCMPCAKNSFKIKSALPDPTSLFGKQLKDKLCKAGITIGSISVEKATPTGAKLLTVYSSPSIESIIKTTNFESCNLYADALLLQLNKGNHSSFDEGTHALCSFVEKATNMKAHFYDGSGLSPMNSTCASQITALLRHMLKSNQASQYVNSLATAGIDGTLRRLGKGTSIEGRVKGKSGSMTGVLGYAGIYTNSKGERRIFCIIINHSDETGKTLRAKISRWLEECIVRY